MASSMIIPRLVGPIIRRIDSNHFIVLIGEKEILGHRDYWHIGENEEVV